MKRTRSFRRHQNERVVKNRKNYIPKVGSDVSGKLVGRCRKNHPCDCGHTKCYCCHCDKLDDIPTKQQIDADLKLKEYSLDLE